LPQQLGTLLDKVILLRKNGKYRLIERVDCKIIVADREKIPVRSHKLFVCENQGGKDFGKECTKAIRVRESKGEVFSVG
jgi:hypothetical protein